MDNFLEHVFDGIGSFLAAIQWKKVFFFFLLPITIPVALFVFLTFDWWASLYKDRKILFFLLSPIYGPLSFALYAGFVPWFDLTK